MAGHVWLKPAISKKSPDHPFQRLSGTIRLLKKDKEVVQNLFTSGITLAGHDFKKGKNSFNFMHALSIKVQHSKV